MVQAVNRAYVAISLLAMASIVNADTFRFSGADVRLNPVIDAFLADGGHSASESGRQVRIVRDPRLGAEQYRIRPGSTTEITVSGREGLAWGLLELGGKPSAEVSGQPATEFRAVMLDVARRYHSPSTLKHLIRWCQAARIRYVQLHLTDDQNWMMPTRVLAGVDGRNGHGKPAYTREELRDLNAFAEARGVTLIPEIDVPGHSSLLVAMDPELFGIVGSASRNCINFASQEVRDQLRALIGEVAEAFPNAPYIHIGGDEAWYPTPEKDPSFAAAIAEGATPSTLFVDFVADLAKAVISHGKTPIVWEGFAPSEYAQRTIPPETVIVAWEGHYYPADRLAKDGYKVINAGWDPSYVVNHFPYDAFTLVPIPRMLRADPRTFGIVAYDDPAKAHTKFPDDAKLIGSLMCWWEGHEWNALRYLPPRILAFGSQLWSGKKEPHAAFMSRYERERTRIERKSHPFDLQYTNSTGLLSFDGSTEIRAIPRQPGLRFAWRTDGNVPTVADLGNDRITLSDGAAVAVQAFRDGRPVGEARFLHLDKAAKIPNLALGAKVIASGDEDPQFPASFLTDGVSDKVTNFWMAFPNPQTATIDLGRVRDVDRLEVVAFWAGSSHAQYRIYLSPNGKDWNLAVDAAKQTAPSVRAGYVHRIPAVRARFIRLEARGGSLFPSTYSRIHEVRAYFDGTR